jgi:hypothetical protein
MKVYTDLIPIGEIVFQPEFWKKMTERIGKELPSSPFVFAFFTTRDKRVTICTLTRSMHFSHSTLSYIRDIGLGVPLKVGMAIRHPDELPTIEGLNAAFSRALPWDRTGEPDDTGVLRDLRSEAWSVFREYRSTLYAKMMEGPQSYTGAAMLADEQLEDKWLEKPAMSAE